MAHIYELDLDRRKHELVNELEHVLMCSNGMTVHEQHIRIEHLVRAYRPFVEIADSLCPTDPFVPILENFIARGKFSKWQKLTLQRRRLWNSYCSQIKSLWTRTDRL